MKRIKNQAGAELCQAQVKLEVVVEVVLEVGFEIGVEVWVKVEFQYLSGCGWAVGLNDNNAILNLVEVVVEVGVELGN